MNEMTVYCYKDFHHKYGKIFERGKEYKCWIERSVIITENSGDDMWVEYNRFGLSGEQGCRFYMKNKRGLLSKFSDYFMTNKELRKQKLKKLYENR